MIALISLFFGVSTACIGGGGSGEFTPSCGGTVNLPVDLSTPDKISGDAECTWTVDVTGVASLDINCPSLRLQGLSGCVLSFNVGGTEVCTRSSYTATVDVSAVTEFQLVLKRPSSRLIFLPNYSIFTIFGGVANGFTCSLVMVTEGGTTTVDPEEGSGAVG